MTTTGREFAEREANEWFSAFKNALFLKNYELEAYLYFSDVVDGFVGEESRKSKYNPYWNLIEVVVFNGNIVHTFPLDIMWLMSHWALCRHISDHGVPDPSKKAELVTEYFCSMSEEAKVSEYNVYLYGQYKHIKN